MAADTIAGVTIPDTALVRDITAYIRDTEPDLLFHHSRRVFLFGALQGRERGLEPDLELLYAGAMFHDLGLVEGHRSEDLRFEVDGANAAREHLRGAGISAEDAHTVWLSIALHTTPGIPEHLDPVIALVTAGVETDVLGIGYEDLSAQQREAVVAAHPRGDFKDGIVRAFADGFGHKPQTTFGTMNDDVLAHTDPSFEREDFVGIIRGNAWPS